MTRQERFSLETVISWTLRLGVLASAAIIVAGVVSWIAAGQGGYAPDEGGLRSLGQVWQGLLEHRPLALMQAGLLVLILTPVLQVAASVAVFIKDRDRAFAILASVVLILLLIGIFYGSGGH